MLDLSLIRLLLIIHEWNLHVDIDPIQQWATDFFLIAGDGYRGTTALLDGVPVIAAWAPVRIAVVSFI